jgi:hypothetical protein
MLSPTTSQTDPQPGNNIAGEERLLAFLPCLGFQVERQPIRRLHAPLNPLVYYELDIDTPVQRAPLRIAIGGIRMG